MLRELRLPTTLAARCGLIALRRATSADLDALITLLSDDAISSSRGDRESVADRPGYLAALERIIEDHTNEQLVAEGNDRAVVGTLQLTLIPGIARRGATRLLVEAVRVHSEYRSAGIGGAMMRWVLGTAAPDLRAGLVQLTSDARRTDAHRFYERMGFTASHLGFKYRLPPPI